ncbi:hypothetical protein J4573_44410 [Actinomadura barringtoniae]|uniref:Uncharacterized protein n=1 Tax=Actinomadura barringtoniae TaxID=1427535 RepID=A0A939PK23_9ACTN|nr:hypothetical protein [Actinomadura barringtoniae]MBO2454196.1 hypothetical protein [Actinomadura barringtoniae]
MANILNETRPNIADTAALDSLADNVLARVALTAEDQCASAQQNLAEFTAADNVSMMGGWT